MPALSERSQTPAHHRAGNLLLAAAPVGEGNMTCEDLTYRPGEKRLAGAAVERGHKLHRCPNKVLRLALYLLL